MINSSKALSLALQLHEGQFRRDNITPYFDHIERVTHSLHSEDEKIVAAFHDVIEDKRATRQELIDFGVELRHIEAIELLTKTSEIDYLAYIERIKHHELARKVKIADICANLLDKPSSQQQQKYKIALQILL